MCFIFATFGDVAFWREGSMVGDVDDLPPWKYVADIEYGVISAMMIGDQFDQMMNKWDETMAHIVVEAQVVEEAAREEMGELGTNKDTGIILCIYYFFDYILGKMTSTSWTTTTCYGQE
ncbi:hypothetical protein ACJX0J_033138, partial [Zea mays]